MRNSPERLESRLPQFDPIDVKRDIDAILWSMKLCRIRRYFHQRFWETETQEAEYASRIEPMPRLETVADHSWHVADTVLLLGGHFPAVNVDRCLRLAILHDKMEIVIGDKNPVGQSGTGQSTHAFNIDKQFQKEASEREAIATYLARLRPDARDGQAPALFEMLEGKSPESRFVKAIDKLQALAFVLAKKGGAMNDKHLRFTLKYSEKATSYFPDLGDHYFELRSRLLMQVARHRNTTVRQIERTLYTAQLPLSFPVSQQ